MLLLFACREPAPPLPFHVELSATDPHALLVAAEAAQVRCVSEEDTAERAGSGTLRWLLAGRTYRCSAEPEDGEAWSAPEEVTVEIPALPADLPVPEVITGAEGVGWRLTSVSLLNEQDQQPPSLGNWLVVYDEQGRPRWQWPGIGGGDLNVEMLPDGTILYGGFSLEREVAPTRIDLDGQTVWTVPVNADGAWTPEGAGYRIGGWNHDAVLSQSGDSVFAIAADLDGKEGEFLLVEIGMADNELRWLWDSEVDGAAWLPYDGIDPYHPNSVQDGGDTVYVNLHNQSRLLAIDKATRQVRWQLGSGGDFLLEWSDDIPEVERRWFGLQHDAKLIDGRLTLYDNVAQNSNPLQSRVVELAVDEEARTARLDLVWSVQPDGDPWYTPIWGGVDPAGEGAERVYDVATGKLEWFMPDAPESRMFRLDAAGEVVWDLQFTDPMVTLYRTQTLPPFPAR